MTLGISTIPYNKNLYYSAAQKMAPVQKKWTPVQKKMTPVLKKWPPVQKKMTPVQKKMSLGIKNFP